MLACAASAFVFWFVAIFSRTVFVSLALRSEVFRESFGGIIKSFHKNNITTRIFSGLCDSRLYLPVRIYGRYDQRS